MFILLISNATVFLVQFEIKLICTCESVQKAEIVLAEAAREMSAF